MFLGFETKRGAQLYKHPPPDPMYNPLRCGISCRWWEERLNVWSVTRPIRPFVPPSNTGRNEWLDISSGGCRFVPPGDKKCNMSAFLFFLSIKEWCFWFMVYIDKTFQITAKCAAHSLVAVKTPGDMRASCQGWNNGQIKLCVFDCACVCVCVCLSICVWEPRRGDVPQRLFSTVFVLIGLHKSSLCHAEDLMSQYLNSWMWCSRVCCVQRAGLIKPTVRIHRVHQKNIPIMSVVMRSPATIFFFFFFFFF